MHEIETVWEVWDLGEGGIATSTADHFQHLHRNSPCESAILLHRFVAATHEEAMSVRNLRMGFGPYVPEGDPEICPLGCGSFYYPKGSGQCPYCGAVRKLTKMKNLPGFDELMHKYFPAESNDLSDAIRTQFGDLEFMLLPSEQTAIELEQTFAKFIEGLDNTEDD